MYSVCRIQFLTLLISVLLTFTTFAQHKLLSDKVKVLNPLGQNVIPGKKQTQEKFKTRNPKQENNKTNIEEAEDPNIEKPIPKRAICHSGKIPKKTVLLIFVN